MSDRRIVVRDGGPYRLEPYSSQKCPTVKSTKRKRSIGDRIADICVGVLRVASLPVSLRNQDVWLFWFVLAAIIAGLNIKLDVANRDIRQLKTLVEQGARQCDQPTK